MNPSDDLFDIIEPTAAVEDEIGKTEMLDTGNTDNDITLDKDIPEFDESQEENTTDEDNSDFVQDSDFMKSLDFENGFFDIDEKKDENQEEESAIDIATDIVSHIEAGEEDVSEDNDESESDDESGSYDDEYDEDDEYDDSDDEPLMVVSEGTSITGSISTDISMLVLGTVNGDITCEGKLEISGKVTGNSFATDIFVNSQRVEGNLSCTGTIKISQGTVVIGNVTAAAAAIGGAVKGDIDVQGPVILDSTAVIKGNIKAKSVQLINGAVLEGFCSVEYSNPQVDEIFQ